MGLKICYIWVEKFRNFENEGFNFNSHYKFYFNYDDLRLTKGITKALPRDFYGKDILDVTGLIGQNGSGKSNVLELVCKVLKGGLTSITTDFLIITEEDNQITCHYAMEHGHQIIADSDISIVKYDGTVDPLKVIYFSNVFDEREHNFEKVVADISNNYRYPRKRWNYDKVTDFEKQLRFIESEYYSLLEIETPDEVRISSKLLKDSSNYSRAYGNPFEDRNSNVGEFIKEYRDRLRDIKGENKFYYVAILTLFIEIMKFINKINNTRGSGLYSKIDFSGFYKRQSSYRIDTLFNELPKWLQYVIGVLKEDIRNGNYTSRLENDLKEIEEKVFILLNSISFLKNLEVRYEVEGSRNRKTEYYIINYYNILKKNHNNFFKLFENSSMFTLDWTGISSGHKAYLNIFSLLYSELRRLKTGNILICIDEGDLYLHPKWQTEFFYRLVTIIPKLKSAKYQFILTSHSPFLVSDLPKQSITLIDSYNSTMNKNGTELENQTFAGNLYALYSEPFFLGNKRMSQFAQDKITSILKQIDSKERLTNFELEEIEHLISLIGDEIIKRHLLNRLRNDKDTRTSK